MTRYFDKNPRNLLGLSFSATDPEWNRILILFAESKEGHHYYAVLHAVRAANLVDWMHAQAAGQVLASAEVEARAALHNIILAELQWPTASTK